MRTWGRTPGGTWVEVSTDANGYDDAVYLTTLAQVLKLNLGESPFYANYGIPAEPSVVQQVQPDYYVAVTQQQFSPYFMSLIIAKVPQSPNQPTPTYRVNVITHQGASISMTVPT